MCVILTLPAGINIDDDKLDCAVANNWHGYGIILKDESIKRLEIRRKYDPDNGANPEEVARILRDNMDVTRYVHLRHTTAGENGVENCHPFSVYNSNSREVYLMHNGTIYDFKPSQGDTRSDTRKFSEEFVSELLLRFEGDLGKADYNSPIIKKIIEGIAGKSNKLLLVSNDLDPLYCNDWVTIRNKDGSEFKASNNDYFYSIKRGPRHTVTPFHGHQRNYPVTVVSSSGSKTTTSGTTTVTGGTTDTGGRFCSTPQSQSPTALVEEAKAARKVVKLKEVETVQTDYFPPKAFLSSLGTSETLFMEYGFQAFTWLRDEEISHAFKQISSQAMVELFRNLIESGVGAQEEIDELLIENQELKEQIEELETKNKAASRKIAELIQQSQGIQELRKVG